MKKFLPSLLPILGLAITTVSPAVQSGLAHFVATHPAYAALVSAVSLILNHWLPSPNALPSDSTVAKAGTALMLCFAIVLVPMGMTGCTYSQAQVTGAVQKVEAGLKDAQAQLPAANLLISELQIVDPNAATIPLFVVNTAQASLPKLIAACDAYLANPSPDTYQAILNLADALAAQVDQQGLAILKIQNPQSQLKAIASVAIVTTGLHVVLGVLQQFASSKQVKAVPAQSAHVSLSEMRPLINREYARSELTHMGYNADAALASAGF